MALINRKAILETFTPLIQAQRFRGKINIQRPRAPHHERQVFLKFAAPFFPRQKPEVSVCTKGVKWWQKEEIENPFQRILAKECLHSFKTSRLVAFYHLNPMQAEDRYKAYVQFHRKKMLMKQYGKKTLEMAVEGTKYDAVLPYFISHNMVVFSPQPDVRELLKINKKYPQLVLMFGLLEGRFVSKDELTEYSLIPNLDMARAGLVQTLQSVGGQMVTQLTAHQNNLVSQLQERMKQLEVADSDEKTE